MLFLIVIVANTPSCRLMLSSICTHQPYAIIILSLPRRHLPHGITISLMISSYRAVCISIFMLSQSIHDAARCFTDKRKHLAVSTPPKSRLVIKSVGVSCLRLQLNNRLLPLYTVTKYPFVMVTNSGETQRLRTNTTIYLNLYPARRVFSQQLSAISRTGKLHYYTTANCISQSDAWCLYSQVIR